MSKMIFTKDEKGNVTLSVGNWGILGFVALAAIAAGVAVLT